MKYILIFILLIVLEQIYFYIANKLNIIDKPNLRSSHSSITLRGGGIIFYFGILLYAIFFNSEYPWFLLALSFISIISFLDDVYTISTRLRLIIHLLSMGILFYQFGLYDLPLWYSVIALVFCTGVINAYNFMDGINGITGGYSLVVLGALAYINYSTVTFIDQNIIIIVLLSVIVFNIYNFRRKAKCFAGDVGSISIAFIILFFLGKLIITTGDLSYIIILLVYGVDSILTIVHRFMLHENIFEAHRKHVYQIMANELKMKHLHVSAIYMILQLLIISGYLVSGVSFRWIYFLAMLFILIICYIIFIKKYYYLHKS